MIPYFPFVEASVMDGGGGANIQPLSVTENKEYNAADYGCDGFNPVDVNVPDRYDEGYKDGYDEGYKDGYDKGHADGEAAVKAKIQSKTITKNGTYYAADDGLYGFDPVNVNVPDRYDDGYADGYNASYDTSFSTASEYYNDPDLSKNYYVYIGLEGDAQKAIYCSYYDTADMKPKQPQMCWIGNMGYSYDPKIISIKWAKEYSWYVLKIKAMGYNSSHTETNTITFTYTLSSKITPSNTTIGSVKYD